MFKDLINQGDFYKQVSPWLIISNKGSKFASIWSSIDAVYNTFAEIGAILLVLYFAMSVLEKLAREQLSPQILVVSTVEFIIAFVIVTNGLDLLNKFNLIAEDIMSDVTKLNFTISPEKNESVDETITNILIQDEIYTSDGTQMSATAKTCLVYIISKLLIPCIMSKIITVAILVQAVTRGIELILYTCFAPLAIPNLFKDGSHSGGIRFLKKYLAIALQAAVMIVIAKACNWLNLALITNDNTAISSNTFYYCASGFVAVIMMTRAQQYANDIVGV